MIFFKLISAKTNSAKKSIKLLSSLHKNIKSKTKCLDFNGLKPKNVTISSQLENGVLVLKAKNRRKHIWTFSSLSIESC